MTSGVAPDLFSRRRLTAPKAAVAFLSALLFVLVLHLGLGAGIASSASATLGATDHAVLRHSALVRDGVRPIVAAEHGDRTSAPPPQSPAALVFLAIVAERPFDFLCVQAGAETFFARHLSAGHRPRAPPIAA